MTGAAGQVSIWAVSSSEPASIRVGTPLGIEGSVTAQGSTGHRRAENAGAVSIKQVDVQFVNRKMVVPCGYPFGIKMFTEGVVVVGLTDVEQNGIFVNPAQQAGIRVGDVITQLDGQPMQLNEDVAAVMSASGGRAIDYVLNRKGETIRGTIQPVLADNGEYKAGIWVRDSSAGASAP